MNELPTLQELRNLLRQGYQVIDYLRIIKRIYSQVVSKTPEQWVLSRFPAGYMISGGKVIDTEGNAVYDASEELQEWAYVRSACVAWRMVVAVLENDAAFRDQDNQTFLKQHHRLFIDPFLPFDKRGEI